MSDTFSSERRLCAFCQEEIKAGSDVSLWGFAFDKAWVHHRCADNLSEANRRIRNKPEYTALETRLLEFQEALIWCSGSTDFNEGGQARVGWLKLCAPLLAALTAQEEQRE